MSNQIKPDALTPLSEIFNSLDMSADITSNAVDLRQTEGYCLQFVWSDGGSPVGNLTLECSNDGQNWTLIEESQLSIADNDGSHVINVFDHHYGYVRVVYDRTSGSATASGTIQLRSRRS